MNRYVIVEEGGHGESLVDEIYASRADAEQDAAAMNENAEAASVPLCFRAYRLAEVDE